MKTIMRTRHIVAMCFGVLIGAGGVPANADNTVVVVQADPYAQAFADTLKRNRQQQEETGRQLGQLIGAAFHRPAAHVTEIILVMKCGHYLYATTSYSDSTTKTVDLANLEVKEAELEQAKAALPLLRVVDLLCD